MTSCSGGDVFVECTDGIFDGLRIDEERPHLDQRRRSSPLPRARRHADRPDPAAGARRQPDVRRPEAQPPVHHRDVVAVLGAGGRQRREDFLGGAGREKRGKLSTAATTRCSRSRLAPMTVAPPAGCWIVAIEVARQRSDRCDLSAECSLPDPRTSARNLLQAGRRPQFDLSRPELRARIIDDLLKRGIRTEASSSLRESCVRKHRLQESAGHVHSVGRSGELVDADLISDS